MEERERDREIMYDSENVLKGSFNEGACMVGGDVEAVLPRPS